MKERYIIVKKCQPDECPYCMPTSYNKSENFCVAKDNGMKVNARIKYFPKDCPLQEMEK
jgi:hypothetical protein